ncbi:hypothetical protein LB518_14355 [Mesorhizobium sp. BR1-1-16]|uniref:hypothetical protein n=1 Tax=Mesorhizobium sp. BR1-1-16 TaxID=2876653 RepID=UPI001CC9EB80|nr:hypothetical protein [Mesorhizobium sp. BR1-1-16]MBZ9937483.1 hypothetical protein [Mesorhizobium sp. BR1-1-16]
MGVFSFSQFAVAETYSIFPCTAILVTVLSIAIPGARERQRARENVRLIERPWFSKNKPLRRLTARRKAG